MGQCSSVVAIGTNRYGNYEHRWLTLKSLDCYPDPVRKDIPLKLADYCFREVAGVLKVSLGTMGRLYVRNSPRPDGDPAEPSFDGSVYLVSVYSCTAARYL